MVEIEFSGNSRYKDGEEYTKYLLREISGAKDPTILVAQVKNLATLGTISEAVAKVLTTYLTTPQEGTR